MTLIKNVDYADDDLEFVQGDTKPLTLTVSLNGVAYDMTGMQVDMQVRSQDDRLIKSLTSAGASPEITILVDTLTIEHGGFTERGIFDYDAQVTDLSGYISTFMAGKLIVKKEKTK